MTDNEMIDNAKQIENHRLENFKGGWFIGDFDGSLLRDNFEVSVKHHPKGEVWDKHYHKRGTEYNAVISGCVEIDGKRYIKDDVFIIYPWFVVDPKFLMDTTIVCVKDLSDTSDKYVIEREK